MGRLAIVFVVMLAGCAQALHWQKGGATQAQSNEDAKLYEFESLKVVQKEDPHLISTFGQELDISSRRRHLTIACMRSKGYEMVQKKARLPRMPAR